MKPLKSAAGLIACGLLYCAASTFAQRSNEVRRAQPVDDTPIPRALPVDAPTPPPRRAPPPPAPSPTPRPSATPPPPDEDQPQPESSANQQQEAPDQRQLEYANGLFARKLYDL